MNKEKISLKNLPNEKGYYGSFGGSFIPPQLIEPLAEIEREYKKAKKDPVFQKEYVDLLKNYVGRPSPLYFAKNLTKKLGGAKIYLKREDLNHTGAHKINHCIGEALLAKRMVRKNFSQKLEPVSTESPSLQQQLCLVWSVKFIWAQLILQNSIQMSSECNYWERKS